MMIRDGRRPIGGYRPGADTPAAGAPGRPGKEEDPARAARRRELHAACQRRHYARNREYYAQWQRDHAAEANARRRARRAAG